MGNDGGSIPHRTEVVKVKQKEERKDQYELARARSRLCAISKTPLRPPLTVCRMGLIYNKEELVKRLIEKQIPKAFRHIKKLKRDVRELQGLQTRELDEGRGESEGVVIVCPITQTEYNGFNKFVVSWPCGCIFSEEALKELKIKNQCVNCGAGYDNAQLSKGSSEKNESDLQNDSKSIKLQTVEEGEEFIVSLNQSPEEQTDYLRRWDEKERKAKEEKNKKKLAKKNKRSNRDRANDDEEAKSEEDENGNKFNDGEKVNKRQKVSAKPEEKSEAYKSLFSKQYEENKDADFLCRCAHRGLH